MDSSVEGKTLSNASTADHAIKHDDGIVGFWRVFLASKQQAVKGMARKALLTFKVPANRSDI